MIEVPKDVAADAAELPFVRLEVTYRANSEGRAKKRHVGAQKAPSRQFVGEWRLRTAYPQSMMRTC